MSTLTTVSNSLALYGNTLLRVAIRRNLVTFPAQIPAFMKPPGGHLQQRAAHLYFVRGWSVRSICKRFDLGKKIVQNLLSDWRVRAISAGLIQEIQAEDLQRLALEQQSIDKDEHLPDYEAARDFYPAALAGQPAANNDGELSAAKLMMALKEECVELGIELSLEQMRKIERIVRDVARPGANAALPLGRTLAHPGVNGFEQQTRNLNVGGVRG